MKTHKRTPFTLEVAALLAWAGFATAIASVALSQTPVGKPSSQKTLLQQQSQAAPPKEQQEISEGDVIRINTTLVTVPVSVMDGKKRYIGDLRQAQFHVCDNDVEQQIAYFASVDKPFLVALLLDISDSTQPQLKLIQEAAITFIDKLRPDDQVIVVAFDSRVRLLAQPTTNREALRAAIRALQSGHGTSLYAVVEETIKQFPNPLFGRKAIVLLTDGVDTTSPQPNFTFESSVRRAEESEVAIYPVQFDTSSDRLDPSNPEDVLKLKFPGPKSGPIAAGQYARARDYLNQLANKTGGQGYVAEDSRKLSEAFARVAEHLRRQYSLGYYLKLPAKPGEVREIKVTVDQPNAIVHARANYVSGGKRVNPSGVKP